MAEAEKAKAAGGVAFASSAISSISQMQTRIAGFKRTGEKARSTIGYAKDEYLTRSNISFEQEAAIDEEMGSMMSQTGLEAMKAESRLRTAAASTGVSGSSVDEVVNQAGYDQLFDNQIIVAKARANRVDTYRSRLNAYMNFEAKAENATQTTEDNLMSSSQLAMESLSAAISTASTIAKLGGMNKAGSETPTADLPESVGTQAPIKDFGYESNIRLNKSFASNRRTF
jgi:hypothetical protein